MECIKYRFKAQVVKTETSNDITEQAYGSSLAADGNFTLFDYQINLWSQNLEYQY
jgi:hypothetical protein